MFMTLTLNTHLSGCLAGCDGSLQTSLACQLDGLPMGLKCLPDLHSIQCAFFSSQTAPEASTLVELSRCSGC
jgi:hypothetical protein